MRPTRIHRSLLGPAIVVLAALSHAAACGDEEAPATEPCAVLDQLEVEYLAQRESGELLLALHPEANELLREQVRLFYGPKERMMERSIISFERQRDGGSTRILFDLDGASANAFFPVELDAGGAADGSPTLMVDGEIIDLELIASPITGVEDAADALADAELHCLRAPESGAGIGEQPGAYSRL